MISIFSQLRLTSSLVLDIQLFIIFSNLLFYSNFSDPTFSLAREINLVFVMWIMNAITDVCKKIEADLSNQAFREERTDAHQSARFWTGVTASFVFYMLLN